MSSAGSTGSQSTDEVQSTWHFHLFYQLFPREQKQLFEQLIAAGRAKQFIMVLSLPLLFHWEGRGKQQRGQTYLLCSANLKWLAEHKTTPFQRGGEMVSLQSSEITVLCKWQQHETQKEARASGYVTPQSHELQLLQVRRLQLRSEGKNWGLALVLAAMTLTLHPFSKCFFFFLIKMYSNPSLSAIFKSGLEGMGGGQYYEANRCSMDYRLGLRTTDFMIIYQSFKDMLTQKALKHVIVCPICGCIMSCAPLYPHLLATQVLDMALVSPDW